MPPHILFILKHRELPDVSCNYSYSTFESGLLNSARFVVDMLTRAGVECKLVQVVDNNCIDREVHQYKPTHVIIEALWVVPSKFKELSALHPRVQWIIRAHSEIPFIANEGIAVEWIRGYLEQGNVKVAANSTTALRDFRSILVTTGSMSKAEAKERVIYLPNYYPYDREPLRSYRRPSGHELHIGCFGALRPLKNQLTQAVAALNYADITGKTLHFHINGNRAEQGGDSNLRNIRALFADTRHQLIEHGWMRHQEFLGVLAQMDLVMQVSLTETFCIVAADAVTMNVPIVVSSEIDWTSRWSQAEATDAADIERKIGWALGPAGRWINRANRSRLAENCRWARYEWLEYFLW